MHRVLLALTLLAIPSVAAAEPQSDLAAAIAAAKDGRCSEALELTRAIRDADRAFYAAHVPTEPHLTACMRERADATQKAAPAPSRDHDDGLGKGGQLAIATGAGVLAWLGGAYVGHYLECPGSTCSADDDGTPNGLLLGGLVATIVTATGLVYVAGRDDSHDDSIATTALGSVGFGLAGMFAGSYFLNDDQILMGAAIVVGSSALGATIGFHFGRSAKKRGLEIMPTASSNFTGAVLGGSF